jgi:hypothetical protein
MSIGFRMKTREEIRVQLSEMSDAQLIEHGKTLREFAKPSPGRDGHKIWILQLEEAREEWRRRRKNQR